MQYGWLTGGKIAFAWDASQGSGQGLGSFAFPYVYVLRINENTKTVADEPIIWNSNFAFAYASIAPNDRGDLGGTVMLGGGSFFETCAALIWDGFSPNNSWQLVTADASDSDTSSPTGGDFTTVRRNGGNNHTWSGGCYALHGGGANANTHSYYLSFGRQQDSPFAKHAVADFDGNGTTDVSVYRPSTGVWYVRNQFAAQWGAAGGDVPVPGDYNGDGTTDLAVYRSATGVWYVRNQFAAQWGAAGDIPVPADYNGDGITDLAVYRPSTGVWYVRNQFAVQWGGAAGDVPVPGDYDGNGTADIGLYRGSTGVWYVRNQFAVQWGGTAGDVPAPGDYDGNGTTDIGLYRGSTGIWYVRNQFSLQWGGAAGDLPEPGDYDGNGTTDVGLYRGSTGVWYVRNQFAVTWGSSTDIPLPLPYAVYANATGAAATISPTLGSLLADPAGRGMASSGSEPASAVPAGAGRAVPGDLTAGPCAGSACGVLTRATRPPR